MSSRVRPFLGVLAATVGLLAASTTVGAAPGANTATAGPCPGAQGITVVVDFGGLGGGVQTRCVTQRVDDGFELLRAAGFAIDSVRTQLGFLCRIDNRPSPAEEQCISTPPATAYWGYWVADRDGPWCYSKLGGLSRTPVAGTVEGWAFTRGGKAEAPRSGTFGRLSGAQRLPASVCDRGPARTTVPPRTGVSTPPAAVPPSSGGAPPAGGSAGAAAGGDPSVAPATTVPGDTRSAAQPAGEEDGATTTQPPTSTSTDPSTTTSEAGGRSDAAVDDTPEDDTPGDGSEQVSTVQLAGSGRSGPGSALGSAVAVGAIGALAGAAFVVNRRRLRPLAVAGDQIGEPEPPLQRDGHAHG